MDTLGENYCPCARDDCDCGRIPVDPEWLDRQTPIEPIAPIYGNPYFVEVDDHTGKPAAMVLQDAPPRPARPPLRVFTFEGATIRTRDFTPASFRSCDREGAPERDERRAWPGAGIALHHGRLWPRASRRIRGNDSVGCESF